jgi:hypothetical protein
MFTGLHGVTSQMAAFIVTTIDGTTDLLVPQHFPRKLEPSIRIVDVGVEV